MVAEGVSRTFDIILSDFELVGAIHELPLQRSGGLLDPFNMRTMMEILGGIRSRS